MDLSPINDDFFFTIQSSVFFIPSHQSWDLSKILKTAMKTSTDMINCTFQGGFGAPRPQVTISYL